MTHKNISCAMISSHELSVYLVRSEKSLYISRAYLEDEQPSLRTLGLLLIATGKIRCEAGQELPPLDLEHVEKAHQRWLLDRPEEFKSASRQYWEGYGIVTEYVLTGMGYWLHLICIPV